MPQADRNAEALAREVAQILESPEFQRSPTLSELLVYLAARHAERSEQPTTEYAIAQDLLKRGAAFDPKDDTSVRVRIRRLRVAIERYYEGRAPGPRLTIPPRSYDLDLVAAPPRPFVTRQRLALLAALGLVLVSGLAWALWGRPDPAPAPPDYPLVQVMPVENLTGASENDFFTDGIQRQLVADLQRFGQVRVFMEAGSEAPRADTDFALRVVLVDIAESMDLGVVLLRPEAPDAPLLSTRVANPILGRDYFQALADVSSQISAVVAGRSGAIARDEDQIAAVLTSKAERRGVSRNLFRCIVLTNAFLEDYDLGLFAEAYAYFRPLMPLAEADPFAAESYGTLIYHAVAEFNLLDTAALPQSAVWPTSEALAYAEALVARFPSAADPYLLLGSIQNAMGLRRAAELNRPGFTGG